MFSSLSSFAISAPPVQWPSETNNLIVRAGTGDARVVAVPFWTTRTLSIPPGQRKEVFTYGPGCGVTAAILSLHGDGIRGVTLSNYPPIALATQLEAMGQALQTTSHSTWCFNSRHEVFVITPTDCVDEEGETLVLSGNRQTVIRGIQETVQRHLPDTQLKLLSYPSELRFGESRSFILQIPAESGHPIRYRGIDSGVCSF
jgi:hypothetical protein